MYRATLLGALAAFVVLLFSVVSRPAPLRSDTAADAFDGARAAALARELVKVAPERPPGSGGDAAAARLVERRFRSFEGGQVSEQRFVADVDGSTVRMRNVTLVLPGTKSDERLVLIAPRDCAAGTCAASSAAASAALVELATALEATRHRKTVLLVSTDGSAAGAAGARVLADALELEPAEAALVISQPGAKAESRPFVVPWSAGPQSASIGLLESAGAAVESEVGPDPAPLGSAESLFRLAIPSGLGEQAVLIRGGVDAIALSSAGDRPLPESRDGRGSLDPDTLGRFGRAALSLTLALDGSDEPLDHGPDTYVPLAGKLIPGWALALLAAALLLPIGLASVDGLARASRRREPVLRTLGWVLARATPFLATLVLAYLMASVGAIPDPEFPFDPAREPLDAGATLALLALVAAFSAATLAARPLGPPAAAEEAVAPAVGLFAFLASAAIWLVNPYFALLLVPAVHLWTAAALPEMRGRALPSLLAAAAGLVLPIVAVAALAASFGVGLEVPWQLLLLFTGQHFGPLAALPLCALGGCLAAVVELALRDREQGPGRRRAGEPRLGSHAGPGSLGGPPSRLTPGHKF